MIFRSSVWLGFPGFIANISVVNGTDMWPSTFCVGSAVGTEIIPPFFCSQLRVLPQGESERKTAVSKRKCGCESEPGYDGFSLCHTPASAFMPPSVSLVRAGRVLMVLYGGRDVGQLGQADPGSSAVFTPRRSARGVEYTKVRDKEPKTYKQPQKGCEPLFEFLLAQQHEYPSGSIALAA